MDITCKFCLKTMDAECFYKYPNGKHGRMSKCKECHKAAVRENRRINIEHYVKFEAARAMLPHRVQMRKRYLSTDAGKQAVRRTTEKYIANNPKKRKARIMVGNAIRDGSLIRKACEVCGDEKSHAHHDDYNKPLEVRFLCVKHHRQWHKENKPID